jgi:hypothetical protein
VEDEGDGGIHTDEGEDDPEAVGEQDDPNPVEARNVRAISAEIIHE